MKLFLYKLLLIFFYTFIFYIHTQGFFFMYEFINRIFIESISKIPLWKYNQNKYNYLINLSLFHFLSWFVFDSIANNHICIAGAILNVSGDLSSR